MFAYLLALLDVCACVTCALFVRAGVKRVLKAFICLL
jgi:hypothetical protein